MRAVTIKEAKAHLNELVEAAASGEEIVLMRGSKHVAAIVALNETDLQIAPRLTDDQAARLWQKLASEQAAGKIAVFDSAEQAVSQLRRPRRRRSRGAASRD